MCICSVNESTEYFQAGNEGNKGHSHLTSITKTVLGACFLKIFWTTVDSIGKTLVSFMVGTWLHFDSNHWGMSSYKGLSQQLLMQQTFCIIFIMFLCSTHTTDLAYCLWVFDFYFSLLLVLALAQRPGLLQVRKWAGKKFFISKSRGVL